MNNWQELETRASAYRVLKRQEELQRQEDHKKEQGDKRHIEEAMTAEQVDRAREILTQLHAEEALKAIAKEVWEEGHIQPLQQGSARDKSLVIGLALISDPIRVVKITGAGKDLAVETGITSTNTEVRVHNLGDNQHTLVAVKEKGLYGLSREAGFGRHGTLGEHIRQLGLEKGLRAGTSPHNYSIMDELTTLDPSTPNALDKFSDILVARVEKRRRIISMPYQIREWQQGVLNQFPSSLQEGIPLTGKELRIWADEISLAPKIITLFHRMVK